MEELLKHHGGKEDWVLEMEESAAPSAAAPTRAPSIEEHELKTDIVRTPPPTPVVQESKTQLTGLFKKKAEPTQTAMPVAPRIEAPAPPPVPAAAPAASAPAEEKSSRGGERRVHERFNVRFRVIITAKNVSFQTFSNDVSAGGMRLQRKVPETLLNKPCKVFIASVDTAEKMEIDCQVIPDGNPMRVRFTELQPAVLKDLQKWIGQALKQKVSAA